MSEVLNAVTEGLAAWTKEDSEDPQQVLEKAQSLGAQCFQCPMAGFKLGPVFAEIRPGAPVLIIGETPGKQEILRGRPFVGSSGEQLQRALRAVNRKRSDVSITNTLLCKPPDSKKTGKSKPLKRFLQVLEKGQDPVRDCMPRLRGDIIKANPKVIVTTGAVALRELTRVYGVLYGEREQRRPGERSVLKLAKQRGHPFRLEGEGLPSVVLIASYHPDHALRSGLWMLGALRNDLKHAFSLADRDCQYEFTPPDELCVWWPRLPEDSAWKGELPDWIDPYHDLNAFQYALLRIESRLMACKARLTVDIETAGIEPSAKIRVVNFRFKDQEGECVFIIPLHYRDGTKVPRYQWFFQFIRRALKCPGGLAGQNFGFDLGHLLSKGLLDEADRNMECLDTMHVHRGSEWGERDHNLGAIMADQWPRIGDVEQHKDLLLHESGGDKEG